MKLKPSKTWAKRKFDSNGVAIKKLAKKVSRLTRSVEIKESDAASTLAANCSATAVVTNLSGVGAGTGDGQRVGTMITAKKLEFHYGLYSNTANVDEKVRVIIFVDTMNLGTLPTAADLLQSNSTGFAPLSPYYVAMQDNKRFKIVYDQVHALTKESSAGKVFHKTFKLGHNITYTGDTGTDEGKGQVCMLYVSDQGTNYPKITWYSRLYFSDA